MKHGRFVGAFPITLFSIIAILVSSGASVSAQERIDSGWYRSNALGMLLEPVADEVREEQEYTLLLEREAGQEIRRLYRDGVAERELVRDFSDAGTVVSEEERVGDELTTRREFDEEGRLAVERDYEDGRLETVDFFSYRGGRLFERRRENGDGDELFVERYRYKTEGLLRRVERRFSAADATGSSEFLYADDELREEWHERGGVSVLIRYDRSGRLVRTEERRDDVLVLSEQFFYPEGDDARDTPPVRSEGAEPEQGRRTETGFDESGRTIAERRYEDDELTEEREFRYENDLLVLEIVRDEEGEQERRYDYDEDGERVSEERTRDGVPERRIAFDGDRRTEERYVDGELALIVEFDGEERVREQVVRDGEVVREREF